MWMRRNAAVRSGGPNQGNGGQMPPEPPFNPNHRRYRTCCCHCKTFTLGFGVVELFLICFVLVAIAPDFNTKICTFDNSGNAAQMATTMAISTAQTETTTTTMPETGPAASTEQIQPFMQFMAQKRRRRQTIERNLEQTNMPEVLAILAQKMSSSTAPIETTTSTTPITGGAGGSQGAMEGTEHEGGFSSTHLLRHVTCSLTIIWLVWAILQMGSIALMCYGVKRQRWFLLIPHIFFRICCAIVVWLVIAALIGALVQPGHGRVHGYIALCIFLFIIFLWIAILLRSEIRCCEFMKRSSETGFSISNTRPIGPPTVSQSDSARGGGPGGENGRRVVKSGIRKMPAHGHGGPSAKRYQTKQQSEDPKNGNEMTMSTLATGGLQTRPSTAGSLMQKNGLGNGGSRANSAGGQRMEGEMREERREMEEENGNAETEFGGENGGDDGGERPARVGELPPLRHTYRMANR